MVRVSADLFVDESKVRFDVDRTDEAIALYCRDNFIPIKNVVDFLCSPMWAILGIHSCWKAMFESLAIFSNMTHDLLTIQTSV